MKFGYDPMKAQQYRLLEAKASAAWEQARRQRIQRLQQEDRLNRLKATQWISTARLSRWIPKGLSSAPGLTVSLSRIRRVCRGGSIHYAAVESEIVYVFLLGILARRRWPWGHDICRAYRDGMQETDGEPMPRWVYVGETLHRSCRRRPVTLTGRERKRADSERDGVRAKGDGREV